MINYHFKNAVTETYCTDKFTIEYNPELTKLEVTPKNAQNILKNNCELEIYEKRALEAYSEAFEKYESEEIAFCFDGGKDGHVVFHLLKNFLQQKHKQQQSINKEDMVNSTSLNKSIPRSINSQENLP